MNRLGYDIGVYTDIQRIAIREFKRLIGLGMAQNTITVVARRRLIILCTDRQREEM
jgi:hypothetical protein